jgi:HlyD family secretion protein
MPTEIYSPTVREIISYKPIWIIRNGNMLFLAVLLSMLGVSFLVKYPDVVQATATLTSINDPKEVKAKVQGLLQRLLVGEGDHVSAQQVLGYMESTARHEVVLQLSTITEEMQAQIDTGNAGEAVFAFGKFSSSHVDVGELSSAFVTFSKAYREFNQYLSFGYFIKKRNMLSADIRYLKRLHNYLMEQKSMQAVDVSLARKTLVANRSLDSDHVISPVDFRSEQSKFISKSLSIPQINAAIVSNESAQHEKDKEIAALENEIAQQKEIFRQSLLTLHSSIAEWESKYLLISPIRGKVNFTNFIQEKQQVKLGATICFIDPGDSEYYAEVNIPQHNFGKIKIGQKVKLKLPAYPFQEFGTIEGRLSFVNSIPSDSGFVAKVDLPNGLQTNYKKQVLYHEGLMAQAEIVTVNTSLASRIFNELISMMRN